MSIKFHLAMVFAVVISACGTIGSVQAGGFGGGHGGGGGHSGGGMSMGHGSSSGVRIGGIGGSGSMPRSLPSSGNSGIAGGLSNAIRSGNLGNSQGLPKNTGIAGGIKLPTNGSTNNGNKPGNTGIAGGIKLPNVGTTSNGNKPGNTGIAGGIKIQNISNNNTNKPSTVGNILSGKGPSTMDVIKATNAVKSIGDKLHSPAVQGKVLGGLGVVLGNGNGNGPGNGPGNGNGNGNGNHHHHHCPPLVFTLPVYQSNYCPPPCPPIYYPVPVAVPVPVDANGQPIDPNAAPVGPVAPVGPAAPAPQGLPMETKQALNDIVASEAPAAVDTEVKPTAATTELVSKDMPLPQIPVGATLTLQGKDLTSKEGQVVLQVGEIALPATIQEWKNDSVTCTLPVLGLTKASKATLHVLKSDGKTASTLNCELVTTLTTSVEARPTTSDIEAAKYEQ
ncbi:hypothetical protein [Anatilimnocola floriformis]|uniref:hypothetical protein n=1 Tax=Anatilimnocola floriformis TaxID=2948575 RepID=UPI0020C30D68|nr:hypothetical protein [Anatilimnocola floriformis]